MAALLHPLGLTQARLAAVRAVAQVGAARSRLCTVGRCLLAVVVTDCLTCSWFIMHPAFTGSRLEVVHAATQCWTSVSHIAASAAAAAVAAGLSGQ
jgi:hypothetical protein